MAGSRAHIPMHVVVEEPGTHITDHSSPWFELSATPW